MAGPLLDGLPRGARPRVDGATFLTVYIVLLFALPSRLVIKPIGAAGPPANVLAIAGIAWWLWSVFATQERPPFRAHPTRRAAFVFAVAVAVSYVYATTRAIGPAELSTADTGLLLVAGWIGLLLVADAGIPDLGRLETVLRRLALAGGLVAALGLAQFATGRAFTDLIQVPGLVANTQVIGVYARDGYTRPAGTAVHPIEFGVTVAALLPICLHVALHHRTLSWARRWLPVMAIVFAIPLSISRSAVVGTLVALVVLLPTLEKRVRAWTLILGAGALTALFVVVPGMLGTITKLFTRIHNDNSALSRTDSYPLAWEFLGRSPVFGRGFQTFLPDYRILDNQYLGLLIDTGIFGMLAMFAYFCTCVATALVARRRYADPVTRSACASLGAASAAAGACFAFVDGLSFPLMAGLAFLVGGLIGSLWAHRPPAPQSPDRAVAAAAGDADENAQGRALRAARPHTS